MTFTIQDLKALKENDGATLENYMPVTYAAGYQVALTGIETDNAETAYKAIQDYNGTCGVWYAGGVYYIDYSIMIEDEQTAIETGRKHKQISILKWADMSLIYC